MAILAWIIIGGLAGWLASVLVRGGGLGLLGDIVVGIVGAFIGGLIVSLLGGQGFTGFNIWSFIVALIGAVVLLLIIRMVRGTSTVAR
ncbi:MAG TPA: GlsB/YeaQ/YmgE family stress response membrane protein [Steroidobacteraceae bacterium]|nr:GlsB/YeaQ/YmgE family stress response membrane protein [Steroidobacteraceae bacterium]